MRLLIWSILVLLSLWVLLLAQPLWAVALYVAVHVVDGVIRGVREWREDQRALTALRASFRPGRTEAQPGVGSMGIGAPDCAGRYAGMDPT